MRANLLFDLDDADDRMEHLRCIKSLDMALAMWNFTTRLKSIVDTSEDGKYIDESLVWKAWDECLTEQDVNLDKLIS